MSLKEHMAKIIKGKIQKYVARESEPISKVVKYVKTASKKSGISNTKLEEILAEIERETVEPFLKAGSTFYQPGRLERLTKAKLGLNLN